MKTLRTVLFLSLLLLSLNAAQAQDGPYLLVRINLTPGVTIVPLQIAGLDIASVKPGEYAEVVCHPADLEVIRNLGYQYKVMIEDMESHYAAQSDDRTMGGFRTWSESVAFLDSIHALYPNITTEKFSIGNTIENRPMWVIKVSDNPNVDEDEPEVFFNGLIHAREPIGMAICQELLIRLTSQYGSNPQITDLVNNREIWIMPVFNVDGYVYNEQQSPQGGGMWRKNRRNNGGSYGIDLNRNWGFNWGYNDAGSSPTPSSETYRGTAAFSEPETQNVRQFCNQRYFGLALNFHSYSDLMIYSWSIPPPAWGYTPDNATFLSLTQTMQQWTGYTYGPAWEILYEVNGDANDWMYGEQNEKPKTLAWVFEVGASFWPTQSLIPGLINENINPALYLIEQAANYQPTPVNLSYMGGVINDAGGNNNGSLDPGETVTFVPTLRNNGWVTGTNISATLIASDPYITITSATSTYPDLAAHQQAASNTPYGISVSSTCPVEHTVQFGLLWTCAQAYTDTAFFNLVVGDPIFQPTGPDQYGYRAYDPFDEPETPVYQWVEISADSGGLGTMVPFTSDDQVFTYAMPFTFRYYGANYDTFTVGANGWVGMGVQGPDDYSNSGIPNSDGPAAMIAAYWEDLSPQRPNSGKVWRWYDQANHLLIVEYNHIEQYSPTGNFETFQVVLYDPAFYLTSTGDGRIKVQYKDMSASAQNEGTVGIENATETVGLQYLFDGNLDGHAHPIADQFAILYTTPAGGPPSLDVTLTPINPPIVIPANGGSFNFTAAVLNNGPVQIPFSVWAKVRNPDGTYTPPTLGPVTINPPVGITVSRQRTQNIPGTWTPGLYYYIGYAALTYGGTILDSSYFTFTKTAVNDGGPFVQDALCYGELFPGEIPASTQPTAFSLGEARPNPFNPTTAISYELRAASFVSLKVYDTAGRLVTTLVNGKQEAGSYQTTFDGSKLSSGLYFVRMQAGDFSAIKKLMLVK